VDIQRALLIVRRWWLPIILGALLAAAAAYGFSKLQPKVYDATAILNVNPGLGTNTGGTDNNALVAAVTEAGVYAQTVKTAAVAQAALAALAQVGQLHHPVDTGALLKNTTTQAASQSTLVTIDVRAQDPNDAAALATALGRALIANVNQHSMGPLRQQLATLNSQVRFYSQDQVSATQSLKSFQAQNPYPSPKQQQLEGTYTDEINRDMGRLGPLHDTINGIQVRLAGLGDAVSLQQPGVASDTPISPRTTVNVGLAALVAFLVLLGVAVLSDLLDARPRTPDDVAALLGLPLLGTVGASKSNAVLATLTQPTTSRADEYRLLRASSGLVAAAAADGHTRALARVLAVVGVREGDGASVVASNLAVTAARAGARTILVDANLRRPALHALFGLSNSVGLATLLRGDDDPRTLLQEGPLPNLRILTVGTAPEEAIDLVSSARMDRLLLALRASADVVVLDAGLAGAPESGVLAALADNTMVVARLRNAGPEALETAGERLRLAGAQTSGVAVTLFNNPAPAPRAPQSLSPGLTPERAASTGSLRGAK